MTTRTYEHKNKYEQQMSTEDFASWRQFQAEIHAEEVYEEMIYPATTVMETTKKAYEDFLNRVVFGVYQDSELEAA